MCKEPLTLLIIAIVSFGCVSNQAKIQHAPVPVKLSDIPQWSVARSVVSSPLSVTSSQLSLITLSWDFNAEPWFSNSTDVYVYASPNLKTWVIKTNSISSLTRSNCPSKFVFPNDKPAEFYQVLVTNVSLRTGWFVKTK